MKIVLIAALGERTRVIGKDNKLLWRLPSDMEHFVQVTKGHSVIMGRRTWESIPKRFRPLAERTNIVVSRQHNYVTEGAQVALSLHDALTGANIAPGNNRVYIIGGGQIYKEALPLADELDLTLVDDDTPGDVFFPQYTELFTKVTSGGSPREENGVSYRFVTLKR